jgi:hypothetical protein
MSIHDTLKERANTHGDFATNAKISQGLKSYLTNQPGYADLTDIQRESIDLICTKLSRIFSGGNGHADNWHDTAGYAILAERELLPGHQPVKDNTIINSVSGTSDDLLMSLKKVATEVIANAPHH